MSAGIDLGSRNVKAARLVSGEIVELRQWDTPAFYQEFGDRVEGRLAIAGARLAPDEGLSVTGYGRATVRGASPVNELKAHYVGALHQTGLVDFTLIDLGGQDSKVILVRNRAMVDFQTNDKCASSSGRYLENMAGVLGIDLAELGCHWADPAKLDSTCAVFGESELIGKIVEGVSIPSLAAGVNLTLFRRIEPFLRRFKSKTIVFVGGVAFNQAIRRIIEAATGAEVIVPLHPMHNAAIGCALLVGK
ncbi:MAG: acyl-CoA dehydratase activase [Dehalococcoidia bacterium]|nr:acyl-CoA dehydratase activase [Dehalococcoidia bacterium]